MSPESAVVPLNQVDYQLASKFEVSSKGSRTEGDVLHILVQVICVNAEYGRCPFGGTMSCMLMC